MEEFTMFMRTTALAGSICCAMALIHTGTASAWSDKLDDAQMTTTCVPEPHAQCSWARMHGAKWAGQDISDGAMQAIRLDGADLSRANLARANFQVANLSQANLMMANLEDAHLHATNLQQANLMLANLTGVNLLDADLRGANLRGAKLQNAILIAAKLDGATWVDGRVCAAGSVGECR
jgi:uncharacterized protein YjbI with pentapeptide repeats